MTKSKQTNWKEVLNNLIEENPHLAVKIVRDDFTIDTELLFTETDLEETLIEIANDVRICSYIFWNYKCYTDLNKFYDEFYKYYTKDIAYTPVEEEIQAEAVKYAQEHIQKAILISL